MGQSQRHLASTLAQGFKNNIYWYSQVQIIENVF